MPRKPSRRFAPSSIVYDCGLSAYGGPFHLITKEDWDFLRSLQSRGTGIALRGRQESSVPIRTISATSTAPGTSTPHRAPRNLLLHLGSPWAGLLYLDVDAHHPWQTDEMRGKAVLEKLFPFGYYCASGRGQNGYLKVRYTSIREFNQVAAYVQRVLKRYFLHLGILCDIEIKGTITDGGKSGSLAKLPFRSRTDVWNYRLLETFKACPIVNARRVLEIARQLEKRIDEEKVRQFAQHKQSLLEEEKKARRSSQRQATKPPKQEAVPVPVQAASDSSARANSATSCFGCPHSAESSDQHGRRGRCLRQKSPGHPDHSSASFTVKIGGLPSTAETLALAEGQWSLFRPVAGERGSEGREGSGRSSGSPNRASIPRSCPMASTSP